jgi:hypothetical protein
MKRKMLSLLAGAAMLGSIGAASAAEPTTLNDEQMDAVSAGATIVGGFTVGGFAPAAVFNTGNVNGGNQVIF